MNRDELITRTRQLAEEGDRLQADPSMGRLRLWLQLSDDLLSAAWGPMDRYHLAWLMVGKPKDVVRGRPMTADEEAAYVRDVATQKTAALRMSLDAIERQGMPFRGEDAGLAPGQGMGELPGMASGEGTAVPGETGAGRPATTAPDLRRSLPLDPALAERVAEARRRAAEHEDHEVRRAPRPERMQR